VPFPYTFPFPFEFEAGGSITPTGALSSQVSRTLAGAITPSGSVSSQRARTFAGGVTPSGDVSRLLSRTLSGAITPSGVLTGAFIPANRYILQVDWNGDGDFADALEDTSAYLMATSIVRGRDRDMGDFNASTCTLTLRNDDKRFTPNYASSPLYPNVRAGLKVRLIQRYLGTSYNLFTGYTDRPSCDHESRTATLYCVDEMKRLGQKRISTALQTDVRTPTILDAVLAAAGFTGSTHKDAGIDQVLYAGWYDEVALSAIRELEQAERASVWIDGDGDMRLEDRHHRLKAPHTTALATYTGIAEAGPYELRVDDVINEADVTASPVVPAAESDIYTLAHKLALAPGASETILIDYSGVALDVVQPSAAALTLVANDAPNDSGTDRSSSIGVAFTGYAAGASVVLTNNHSTHVYVTTYTVKGKKLDRGSITKHTEDATSQTQYGERSTSLSRALMANPNVAQSIADYIVATKKDPADGIDIEFTASKNAANMLAALTREISDRVHIEEDVYSVDGDFFIEGIEHSIQEGGLNYRVTWRLSEAPASENLFIIGTTLLNAGALMAY